MRDRYNKRLLVGDEVIVIYNGIKTLTSFQTIESMATKKIWSYRDRTRIWSHRQTSILFKGAKNGIIIYPSMIIRLPKQRLKKEQLLMLLTLEGVIS